jgi:flagellar basal-body rod modification protein FlgD
MAGLDGITSAAATAPRATTTTGSTVLGKDDFLRLLITQLRYQDPLNPLDQNQFLAQTAQFTSLEHLQNITAGIENLGQLLSSSSLSETAALVGRTVRASTRPFAYEGAPVLLPFAVDAPVSSVTVEVRNAGGAVVRRLTTGAVPAGAATVAWDGRDAAGQPMTAGTYTYAVSSTGAGQAVAVEGPVTSVGLVEGLPAYRVGDVLVRAWDIIEVR